jgi:HSP20 family protein
MAPPDPETMPETPAERLRDFVVGCLDAVAAQGGRAVDALQRASQCAAWVPHADVADMADQVQVVVDLPGVDPRQVEITLAGNMLTVRGQRPAAATAAQRRERPTGSFSCSFPLPAPVDPERVAASSELGVLTVTLAKEERIRPRHIRVQVASDAAPAAVPMP